MVQKFGDVRTLIKLEIISRYADIYLDVLKNSFNPTTHYIDCFSVTGEIQIKGKIISGSAKRMLDKDFDYFHFIESNRRKLNELKNVLASHPNYHKCCFYFSDVNFQLEEIVKNFKSHERGLVFLDPFGLQVKFSTIEKLKDYKILDIFCLFPVHTIQRAVPHNKVPHNKGKIHSDMVAKVCECLGDTEEFITNKLYDKGLDLFGDDLFDRIATTEAVQKVYFEKLKEIFPFVNPAIELRRAKKPVLFVLFLFTTNDSTNAIRAVKKLADYVSKIPDKLSSRK